MYLLDESFRALNGERVSSSLGCALCVPTVGMKQVGPATDPPGTIDQKCLLLDYISIAQARSVFRVDQLDPSALLGRCSSDRLRARSGLGVDLCAPLFPSSIGVWAATGLLETLPPRFSE